MCSIPSPLSCEAAALFCASDVEFMRLPAEENSILAGRGVLTRAKRLSAFAAFDGKVDSLLAKYLSAYSSKRKKLESAQQRRLLGVWLTVDGKREPILPLSDAIPGDSQ